MSSPARNQPTKTSPASRRRAALAGLAGLAITLGLVGSALGAAGRAYITSFRKTTTLASTVPANGDQNPYGIVIAPRTIGRLHAGDVLVSNFNNRGPTDSSGRPTGGGNQGEGTTIMRFSRRGTHPRLFAHISRKRFPGGVGLTTALAALPDGYVVVGSLPTSNGMSATMKPGELIILSPRGHVVGHISGSPINGPWDMAAVSDDGVTTLFVTNVLNGTVAASPHTVHRGTVVRIRLHTGGTGRPSILGERVIAKGFAERTDPGALVVGPTGVGLGPDGALYVADSVNNRIARIPDALDRQRPARGGAQTLTAGGHLNDPLGLTIAPGGDILSANGANGDLVETTPAGHQVAVRRIDHNNGNGAGDLFGITVPPRGGVLFVDDFDNTLRVFH